MSNEQYLTKIELQKESMKFAAGHTTIFSATEREPLHGHTYNVYLGLTTRVDGNGMSFDYRYYKKKIHALCEHLNQTFLMPTKSPYMHHESDDDYYYFYFNHKKIPFLKEDVTLMPMTNITVEEISKWMVERLIEDSDELARHAVEKIKVKVFSAPGQSGSHLWKRPG